MIDPLTDEEILILRKLLERRAMVIKGIYGVIGTAIGGAILSALDII